MALTVREQPPDVIRFFKEQGAKGGRMGGRRTADRMTGEQRVARTNRAGAVAVVALKKSAKKTK